MKMIRATLKLTLVLYICTALSGVYVLSTSAKITPHSGDDDTMLVTIVKGDTLWDLCQQHLKDPLRWQELKKYNEFTNPHLIYPGEQLRIPVAMAKEVVETAKEEVVGQQEELERLRVELAESEATRDKLMADINELNQNMGKLQEKLKALEGSLKSQEKLMDVVNQSSDTVSSSIKEALAANKAAILDKIARLDMHMEAFEKLHEEYKTSAKATHERIEAIQGNVATLLQQIEMNQKAISELKMMIEIEIEDAKGVHEEISSSKRALVVLTTIAAGIGWFAINAIGGRSSE